MYTTPYLDELNVVPQVCPPNTQVEGTQHQRNGNGHQETHAIECRVTPIGDPKLFSQPYNLGALSVRVFVCC